MTATRDTVVALWGEAVVERALAEPEPEPITPELANGIAERARALGDTGFAGWALAQSWPRFCTIVRLCAGVTRRETEET